MRHSVALSLVAWFLLRSRRSCSCRSCSAFFTNARLRSLPQRSELPMPPDQDSPAPTVSRRRLGFAAIVAVAVAGTVVVFGVTSRKMADARLSEWTEKQAVPVVAVTRPDTRSNRSSLDIPGRLEAYSQAQIYSRVSGY